MNLTATALRSRAEKAWRPLLVCALCFGAFWPTLKTGFMIDDPFLLRAVQLEPGLTVKGAVSDFTDNVHKEPGLFYYRPLLGLMVRAEYAAWGGSSLGYHALSLSFHAVNAVLLFYLLSALGFAPGVALGAACLFAVNPVIVDDLLAATGGESMANFFMLSVLLLYLKNKWGAAWLLSVPAMFAKESNVLLPVLLALCLAYQGRLRKEYARALWLLPLCALFLTMRGLYVASPAGFSIAESANFLFTVFPDVIFHYLAVLLAPLSLETWPVALTRQPYWGLSLAGLLAGTGALFLLPVPRRVTAFCLSWFILLLAPRVPAILATQVMMDKWVFMASPAVFVFLLTLLMKRRENQCLWLRAVPALAVSAACLFWMTRAHAEVRLRGSDEKNYRWTVRHGPRSFASYRLGIILMHSGRPAEAAETLRPLLRLYPGQADFKNAYAMALWHSGNKAEAWNLMQTLQKENPGNSAIGENAARMRQLMKAAAFNSARRSGQ